MKLETGALGRVTGARLLFGGLILAAVARLWIMPLGSSLGLDEFGTWWVTNGRFDEILARARLFPQSVLYAAVLWLTRALAGPGEIALRLPSLLAAAAGGVLALSAGPRALRSRDRDPVGRRSSSDFARSASRRPTRGPTRLPSWRRWAPCGCWCAGSRRAGAGTRSPTWSSPARPSISSISSPRCSSFTRPTRSAGGGGGAGARPWQLLAAAAGIGLLVAPAGMLARDIGRDRAVHAFEAMPGAKALLLALVPTGVLAALLGERPRLPGLWRGVSETSLSGPEGSPSRDPLWLLALWVVVPPVLLFLIVPRHGHVDVRAAVHDVHPSGPGAAAGLVRPAGRACRRGSRGRRRLPARPDRRPGSEGGAHQ